MRCRWKTVNRHDRGLQYDLKQPSKRGPLQVRVRDKSNKLYGEYSIPFSTLCDQRCSADTPAPARRL